MKVSIIVEWDNPRLAGTDRAAEMLRALSAQAGSANVPLEILICGDDTVPADRIAAVLGDAARICRFLNPPVRSYYELKNFGAQEATGDIIVFLDSDVIPETGWLTGITTPFNNPAVQVVAANCYLDSDTAYSKSLALTWLFPVRASGGSLRPVRRYYANSVAFRKHLFLRYPFEPLAGCDRGACLAQCERLKKNGVVIYENPAARVRHPPPGWGRHLLARAAAHGRDDVIGMQALGGGWAASPVGSVARFGYHMARGAWRVLTEFHKVNLPWYQIPLALGIGTGYYGIAFGAEIMTFAAPGYMRRHFRLGAH